MGYDRGPVVMVVVMVSGDDFSDHAFWSLGGQDGGKLEKPTSTSRTETPPPILTDLIEFFLGKID